MTPEAGSNTMKSASRACPKCLAPNKRQYSWKHESPMNGLSTVAIAHEDAGIWVVLSIGKSGAESISISVELNCGIVLLLLLLFSVACKYTYLVGPAYPHLFIPQASAQANPTLSDAVKCWLQNTADILSAGILSRLY